MTAQTLYDRLVQLSEADLNDLAAACIVRGLARRHGKSERWTGYYIRGEKMRLEPGEPITIIKPKPRASSRAHDQKSVRAYGESVHSGRRMKPLAADDPRCAQGLRWRSPALIPPPVLDAGVRALMVMQRRPQAVSMNGCVINVEVHDAYYASERKRWRDRYALVHPDKASGNAALFRAVWRRYEAWLDDERAWYAALKTPQYADGLLPPAFDDVDRSPAEWDLKDQP